jgi:hypothetical protein
MAGQRQSKSAQMSTTITSSTPIASGAPNASYDTGGQSVPQSQPQQPTTTVQDIVDIVAIGTSPSSTPDKPSTYAPKEVADKFRYNIENGMFDQRLRYNALSSQFQGAAQATYDARQNVVSQVGQLGGSNSSISALFALTYQDAQPNPNDASTHVEARTEQTRQMDQGLNLLNML